MAALTHDFLGQALELWQKVSPGIVVDCVARLTQKRKNARCWNRTHRSGHASRSDRPILELLRNPAANAVPGHGRIAQIPPCKQTCRKIRLPVLKRATFHSGLNRMYPAYGDWLHTVCEQSGFTPRIVREGDGAASALAFVAAGFGVALVSQPIKKFPARDVVFRDLLAPKPVKIPLGAVCRNGRDPEVVSKFVTTLSQAAPRLFDRSTFVAVTFDVRKLDHLLLRADNSDASNTNVQLSQAMA